MKIALALPILLVATALAPELSAQSITTGSVSGTVRDAAGAPLAEARVVLGDSAIGWLRAADTGPDGRFGFQFVSGGEYTLLVERLWYRPVELRGIPVRPGRETSFSVTLSPQAPPVAQVEVAPPLRGSIGPTWPELSQPGAGWWWSRLELEDLPDASRDLSSLGRFTSASSGTLETEGLPARFTGVVVDGMPFVGAMHPDLPERAPALFPLSGVEEAELLTNGLDVEFSEFPGGVVSAYSRRGSRRPRVAAFADWSGAPLAGSKYFSPDGLPHDLIRSGVLVSAPVIRDSSDYVVGGEFHRLETPFPRPWASTVLDDTLVAFARDSGSVDLTPYLGARTAQTVSGSGFGRFDWRLADRHVLSARASAARVEEDEVDLGGGRSAGLGLHQESTEIATTASLMSQVGDALGLEIRAGVEYSARRFDGADLPSTVVTDGPVSFGTDPALPGRFARTGFRGGATLHARLRSHVLKLGGVAQLATHDQTYAFGRRGQFVFAGVEEFARREGSFLQAVGPLPVARFATGQFAMFLQDSWQARPGLELTAGFRLELERLPAGDLPSNDDWQRSAGADSARLGPTAVKPSPRLGLRWDVGNRHVWLVQAEVGTYQGLVDPGMLAAALTQGGKLEIRRGYTDLSRWPALPDSVAAPIVGSALTLLAPKFRAPRSRRAAFGLTGSLDPYTSLHVAAAYRHTDFLPRQHDLNLSPAPSGLDQYGRPVYGTLMQQGSLLGAQPGSNRRFAGFDRVSAIDPDGFSDYWGITARLERRAARWMNLAASYTHSRTEDNWLSGRGSGPEAQLTPFPGGLDGHDWAEGTSDFDVPHVVAAGAEVVIGPLRLAGSYRLRSGVPFTPGFRPGVDANGDGADNDPAYVDDQVAGVSDLFARWDCLRQQVGRYAERNACRGPVIHTLDLRVTVASVRVAGHVLEFVGDALNLIETNVADRDRALYLIDRNGSLAVNPSTGNVTLPLVVNPGFGEPVVQRTLGRRFRVGVRVRYE